MGQQGRKPAESDGSRRGEKTMKGSIVPRGILTLGLSAVLLAATASSASAVVTTLDPTSTDFGDRQVGTTSPAQAFTLNHRCQIVTIDIGFFDITINECAFFGPSSFPTNIVASGDFAATDDCPATLTTTSLTGVSCTINGTFTPTSTGPKEGTLSTGTGGPTATLTGNGVTVPTPPTPPEPGPAPPEPAPPAPVTGPTPPQPGQPALQLDLDAKKQELRTKLTFFATTNVDSTLVAGGSIKQTTKQLVGGDKTKVNGKLKSSARKKLAKKLDKKGKAKAKVEVSAASETSGTAIDEIKVKLKD